jgi:EAL domain-containing protein (putative c-di-GMP-specific phosphodiesterase class I)
VELRGAIERDELVVHYQPMISLAADEVVGFEALVRWQHPTRGLVAPMDFVPIAEDTGFIIPLGTWVLDQACAAASRWPARKNGQAMQISVNLSARQLFDPHLADTVRSILNRNALQTGQLTLEITESVLMEDTDLAVLQLNTLKHVGVQIAIDDFGTGYSSLSYLRTFPVDVLKIDKSFTESVAVDVEGACFVQAILHLAQVLRVATVAEGIEHEEQAVRLRELGCELGQGFYFGRPSEDALSGRIAHSRSDGKTPILEAS